MRGVDRVVGAVAGGRFSRLSWSWGGFDPKFSGMLAEPLVQKLYLRHALGEGLPRGGELSWTERGALGTSLSPKHGEVESAPPHLRKQSSRSVVPLIRKTRV